MSNQPSKKTFGWHEEVEQDGLRLLAGNALASYKLAESLLKNSVREQQEAEFGQYMGKVVNASTKGLYVRKSPHFSLRGFVTRDEQGVVQPQKFTGTFNRLDVVDLDGDFFPGSSTFIPSNQRLATCVILTLESSPYYGSPYHLGPDDTVVVPLFMRPSFWLEPISKEDTAVAPGLARIVE